MTLVLVARAYVVYVYGGYACLEYECDKFVGKCVASLNAVF